MDHTVRDSDKIISIGLHLVRTLDLFRRQRSHARFTRDNNGAEAIVSVHAGGVQNVNESPVLRVASTVHHDRPASIHYCGPSQCYIQGEVSILPGRRETRVNYGRSALAHRS